MIWIRQDPLSSKNFTQNSFRWFVGAVPLVVSGEISTMECTHNANMLYENDNDTNNQ